MASGSGGSSTTAGYIEWAHEVAKPFEDRNIRSNHEHWGFDENKHAVVFKKFRDTFFSDRYICFLDLEFGPGLDYMLGKENDRPRYEKRDFGNKVISQTQAPVYTQLYYACARLVYENGDVRDLWFPWYLFQTKYGCAYESRNSPSEKSILNCMYAVFQHMLRNENAIKILSYGEQDVRLPERFFDAVRRANTDLFQDPVEYECHSTVTDEIHKFATYQIPRERYFESPKKDEAAAWSTLVDLGWKGKKGTDRAQDIRDLVSPHYNIFLNGQEKYLDMKSLNSGISLENTCKRELGQQDIKGKIPDNFSTIFFRLATMTWTREIILYPNEGMGENGFFKLIDAEAGVRNYLDMYFAGAFGESLSQYCARDVHWIYALALNSPAKYFGNALKTASFPVPDSRPVSSTTIVMFDWLREEYAATPARLAKYIEDNSLTPRSSEPSQSPHEHEMRDTDSSWSGDEARNAGVIRYRSATNPYLIVDWL